MTGVRCQHCSKSGVRVQGTYWLCMEHYRFTVMAASSNRRGHPNLKWHQVAELVPADMQCCVCDVDMVWSSATGDAHDRKKVMSLRWFQDGQPRMVCKSCSTKSTFAPSDTDALYHDPKSEKFCPICSEWKPLKSFYADTKTGHRGNCIPCDLARTSAWAKQHRKSRAKPQSPPAATPPTGA